MAGPVWSLTLTDFKSYKQGFLKDAESSLAVTAGQAASMAAIPHSFLGGADMDALLWGPGDQSNSLPEHAKVRKQGAACILGIVLETDLSRGRPCPQYPKTPQALSALGRDIRPTIFQPC